MKRKSLLFLLLAAMFAPLAMNGQRAALYTEGFEGMSSASDLTSAGWISYQTSSGSFLAIETTATNVHTGSKALNIDSWDAGSSSDYVVVGLPIVNATINTLQITFSYKVSTGTVDVGYLTNANDASTFVSLESFNASSSYTTKTVELSGAPSTATRIAIKYLNWYRCYVDDIKVEAIPSCFEPQNLSASLTSCNGSIATLTWERNPKGNENAWVLEYSTNSNFSSATSVNVSNNPTADLTGLTPETTYYARVKANCGTNDESDWSATCEFKPTDVCSIVVSEGTSTNSYAPLYGNYKSSYDQMIYTASQLEDAGITGPCSITKIGFNSSTVNTVARKPVIYICQTDKNAFSSTSDFVSINEFTKVYDFNDHSQWNIAAGWNEFELDTPFEYDGSSNLIIAMHCGIASDYSSTSFYASTASGYQVIYAYHDSTDPIPATYEGNWSSFSNKNYSTSLPSLKLYYEPVEVSCAKPTGLAVVANSLTAHGVTMQWDAEAGDVFEYAIELGTGIDPTTVTYAGSITATGTTCSMTWNNLLAERDYTVIIRKNCGSNGYSQAATKVIHTAIACPAPTAFTGAANGTSATLSWQGNSDSYDIAWSVNPNANPDDYIDPDFQINGTTGSMSNMSIDTDYYFWVRANCGSTDGTSTWVGPITVHIGYCTPAFSSTSDFIASFSLGDINNASSGFSTDGYGNFTSMTTTLEVGAPASASLTSSSGSGNHGAAIWIDFNDDMVFESSERVGAYANSIGASTTVTIDLTIPSDAAAGSHRMRVVYQYNHSGTSIDPCASGSYGEGEDYTVIIDAACAVPTGLTAELMGNAAELSWTSATDTYNVQYREVDPTAPATIILNVPTDIWEDGSGYQMLLDADATAYGDVFTATSGWTATDYSAFEYLIPTDADCSADATHFVIENSVSIQIPAGTYDWCIVNPSPGDKIYIAASNGNVGGRQDDYVFEPGMTYEFTPSLYGSNDGIDVTITDNNTWTLVEGVNNPYTLENLSAQATYKYKVQGVDCDGNGNNTDWSASATFTTGEFYVKHITGYGTGKGNWYLIASPIIGDVAPTEVTNMLSNNYDLFYFDQAKENEWVNYKPNESGEGNPSTGYGFDLQKGKGYLYANKYDVDLVFTGSAYTTTDGRETVQLAYTNTADGYVVDLPGWNLVGNPFAEKAYLEGNRGFYTMDGDGNFTPVTNASIESMEGIFVVADPEVEEDAVTFTTSEPTKGGNLALNLSNGRKAIDRAIVRFDGGRQLPKLQLFGERTKLYIPVEGQDYAIVSGEEMGELPVSFKAEENGTYSLNLSSEAVSFAYLHLIDNLTGADVDLLQTPSYSFEARTTDYANRFKLVFATGSSTGSETFAFYSNGSFVINNEGEATLQVVDVMGRIVKSESINGCANVSVNAAPGVYMLRLVNGDNVKVQKVVVK